MAIVKEKPSGMRCARFRMQWAAQSSKQKGNVTRPANHAHTTSVRTSVSASTTLFDAHLECYAFDESQLVLIKSEPNQLSDIKDKDKPSSSYSGGPGTEQWAKEVHKRRTSSAATPDQTTFFFLSDTHKDLWLNINQVHQQLFGMSRWRQRKPKARSIPYAETHLTF